MNRRHSSVTVLRRKESDKNKITGCKFVMCWWESTGLFQESPTSVAVEDCLQRETASHHHLLSHLNCCERLLVYAALLLGTTPAVSCILYTGGHDSQAPSQWASGLPSAVVKRLCEGVPHTHHSSIVLTTHDHDSTMSDERKFYEYAFPGFGVWMTKHHWKERSTKYCSASRTRLMVITLVKDFTKITDLHCWRRFPKSSDQKRKVVGEQEDRTRETVCLWLDHDDCTLGGQQPAGGDIWGVEVLLRPLLQQRDPGLDGAGRHAATPPAPPQLPRSSCPSPPAQPSTG